MARKRSRTFALELYPEDKTHNDILYYIIQYYEYAFILHDKDIHEKDVVDEDTGEIKYKAGEKKKEHYHVIISFYNPRELNKVLKELQEIGNINHIETCNFYAYTRYLIHLDNPRKYQYSREYIQTNMRLRIDNALKREYDSKEQKTRLLLDYIRSFQGGYVTFNMLTDFALENDCLIELQRNTYFYKQYVDDFGFRRM